MKQCQFCNATFESLDAYQIHLGVGAPAFHSCNDATEMRAKGMWQNKAGEWRIDEHSITHENGWAYLKEQETHPGVCIKCERDSLALNATGLCEGCTIEEQEA